MSCWHNCWGIKPATLCPSLRIHTGKMVLRPRPSRSSYALSRRERYVPANDGWLTQCAPCFHQNLLVNKGRANIQADPKRLSNSWAQLGFDQPVTAACTSRGNSWAYPTTQLTWLTKRGAEWTRIMTSINFTPMPKFAFPSWKSAWVPTRFYDAAKFPSPFFAVFVALHMIGLGCMVLDRIPICLSNPTKHRIVACERGKPSATASETSCGQL